MIIIDDFEDAVAFKTRILRDRPQLEDYTPRGTYMPHKGKLPDSVEIRSVRLAAKFVSAVKNLPDSPKSGPEIAVNVLKALAAHNPTHLAGDGAFKDFWRSMTDKEYAVMSVIADFYPMITSYSDTSVRADYYFVHGRHDV